jgi:hypothetical protein
MDYSELCLPFIDNTVVSSAILGLLPIRIFSLKMMSVIGMKMMKSL